MSSPHREPTSQRRPPISACLALAATCLALAVLLAPNPAPAQSPTPGGRHLSASAAQMATTRAGAGSCVAWRHHQRRVVKRVWRQGEWKRVVRVRRWRTCARRATPAPLVPGPIPAPSPAAPAAPAPEPDDPALQRLGIKAAEWSYTLSRPQVTAGELLIELNNAGEDPHNLHLRREDGSGPEGSIATVGPAEQGRAKLVLPAGTYRLWCDLSEHAERGMEATLLVTD